MCTPRKSFNGISNASPRPPFTGGGTFHRPFFASVGRTSKPSALSVETIRANNEATCKGDLYVPPSGNVFAFTPWLNSPSTPFSQSPFADVTPFSGSADGFYCYAQINGPVVGPGQIPMGSSVLLWTGADATALYAIKFDLEFLYSLPFVVAPSANAFPFSLLSSSNSSTYIQEIFSNGHNFNCSIQVNLDIDGSLNFDVSELIINTVSNGIQALSVNMTNFQFYKL